MLIFDMGHFGASIHPNVEMHLLPQMVSKVLSVFRKIIVESRPPNITKSIGTNTSQLVQAISTDDKVTSLRRNRSGIFDNDTPVQIMVVANIYPNAKDTILSLLDAGIASRIANDEHPGTVDTILLSLSPCNPNQTLCPDASQNTVFDLPYGDPNIVQKLRHIFLGVEMYGFYLMPAMNKFIPKVGIIWDMRYFERMVIYVDNKIKKSLGENGTIQEMFRVDIIILEVVVSKSDIVKTGAIKTGVAITQDYWSCESTWSVSFPNELPKRTFPMYIKLTGCNGNHSELLEVAEIARFWELMNSWAVKENRTVFMDSAFETTWLNAKNSNITSTHNSLTSLKPALKCGWWTITKYNNSDSGHGVLFENQKSMALRLYEKLHKPSEKRNRKSNAAANGKLLIIILALVSTVALFIASAVSICLIFHYRSKYLLSKEEVNNFVRGGSVTVSSRLDSLTVGASGNAESQPYNKAKYEVVLSSIKIDTTRCLGSGEFGLVHCGTINCQCDGLPRKVAVKTVKKRRKESNHGHYLTVIGLISEIKISSYVGEHRNIIKLEGAYTAKLRSGEIFVFLEFCKLGSLDKYLRNYKSCHQLTNETGTNEDNLIEIEPQNQLLISEEMFDDLYRWSKEIVCGMEYLASKKIVHADLATRNILLDNDKVAKVSDFGLSTRLYDYTEYLKTESEALPWKWMAPDMIFNEKSDVWAFGVTLWKMFTLGDEPYSGLAWNTNFPTFLYRGHRLPEPRYNILNIYSVMKLCWAAAPSERPTFLQLKTILRQDFSSVQLNDDFLIETSTV